MQRQSLGSPVAKLHGHGGGTKEGSLAAEDQKVKDQSCLLAAGDEDENKSQKPHKPPPRPERFIHLIPILTLFCFLILYLCSHDPSQKDLAQFNGFNRSLKPIDSTEIGNFGRVLEIGKGGALAIRSVRNLQELGRYGSRYRSHRKIGDF